MNKKALKRLLTSAKKLQSISVDDIEMLIYATRVVVNIEGILSDNKTNIQPVTIDFILTEYECLSDTLRDIEKTVTNISK